MERFLESVARSLFDQYGDDLSRVTLVFPSKRAGLFFSRYLGRLVTKPILSPQIVTINKFIEQFSSIAIGDRLTLLMQLYSIYRDVSGSDESFDQFYHWGVMLLSDFDDVDKYLVDAAKLYRNLEDAKEIEQQFHELETEQIDFLQRFWTSVGSHSRNGDESRFKTIWNNILPLYLKLKERLKRDGIGYEGIVYRDVVDLIEKGNSIEKPFENSPVIVIGLNALTGCEKVIFDYLSKKISLDFFWDYDTYYSDNPYQEAGLFMRENIRRFPQSSIPYSINNIDRSNKSVHLVSVPSNVGQTTAASSAIVDQLRSVGERIPFDRCAIVLCDESLLLPTLSALPTEINKVNVTMGYPLKHTPIYSLIKQIILLHKRVVNEEGKPITFYHKDVVAILEHQLVLMYAQENGKIPLIDEIKESIVKHNTIRVTNIQLGKGDRLLSALFREVSDVLSVVDYLKEILNIFYELLEERVNDAVSDYNREFTSSIFYILNRLGDLIISEEIKIFGENGVVNVPIFFALFEQYIRDETLPFEGDPLEGLQIMGILESRVLDFEHVVILSMNDDVMPGKGSSANSFIPYDLRRAFSLPSMDEKGAMYAYYFYRLIQRAGRVDLIYNSTTSGLSTGEKSRFIYQLESESGLDIVVEERDYSLSAIRRKPIRVEKGSQTLDRLAPVLSGKRPLSPTAINCYLECELRFFYRYIAKIQEVDKVEEEIDARLFGNIFHKAAELLYEPYVGSIITAKMFTEIIENSAAIEEVVYQAFVAEYFDGKDGAKITGKSILVYETLKTYITKLVEIDRAVAPIELIGMEGDFYSSIPIYSGKYSIRVGGLIDRYDIAEGSPRIIDYKSGSAEYSFGTVADLFDGKLRKRNKAALQTLIYSKAFIDSRNDITNIRPGIYQLRSIYSDDFSPYLICKECGVDPISYGELEDRFEPLLQQLLEEIFSDSGHYNQTDDSNRCSYCPYNQLCLIE